MITKQIDPVCYRCICRVCGHAGCPHRPNKYHRCYYCMINAQFRPILDCDNFYFKHFKRYKVRRVYIKPKVRYVDRYNSDDVRIMLTEILRILKSDISPVTDINCIKHNCICLNCPKSSICKDRCKNCKSYKGEYPVKLCAFRIM